MAKKKSNKSVATITHGEARRSNIPTAELKSVVSAEQKAVKPVKYPRNTDVDPQLVWRGKDEQDWSDLVVGAPPLYIQEKVHPKVLVDDLLKQAKAVDAKDRRAGGGDQMDLFADFNGLPDEARSAEFYQPPGFRDDLAELINFESRPAAYWFAFLWRVLGSEAIDGWNLRSPPKPFPMPQPFLASVDAIELCKLTTDAPCWPDKKGASNEGSGRNLNDPLRSAQKNSNQLEVPSKQATESPDESDDALPAKQRRLSPSRVKAKATYDWGMSKIPGAEDMTIAELYNAIELHPSIASDDLPPNAEAFGKYLRDAGVKRYLTKADKEGGSVRRPDEI
jgi:hypothetical protein